MSVIRIIGDRNGRIWPLVLCAVREGRKAGRGQILYVPEQMTLQAERDLITGLELPGLLDIRVISPRKLKQQVREQMGAGTRQPLNEMGRAMAVHRVMTDKEDELQYYRNMTALPGAVKRVGGALDELRESEITPAELADYAAAADNGAERAKLGDLETVWSGYLELISDRFDEEKTVWTDMLNRLEQGGLWAGVDLLVYGFDTVRPDLRELLVRICGQVNSAAVFLTMDDGRAPDGRIFVQQRESVGKLETALAEAGFTAEEIWPHGERPDCAEPLRWLDRNLFALDPAPWKGDTGGAVNLYAGSSPWDETEQIAAALRAWHAEGIPWSGMTVALPAGAANRGMLRAGLKINGIPCVWQENDRAADHPVCRMLLSALGCLSGGYRTDRVIDVARSGYCNLTEEEGLKLEDYARAHGIEDYRWERPFTAGEEAAKAEALRLQLLGPIETLRGELNAARDAGASVEALVRFLEAEKVWEALQTEEEVLLRHDMYREAVINRQVWKLVMDLLEQLWTLLGGRRALMKDLAHMLESALTAAELSALPEEESGVAVGEAGHLLAGRIEALVLPRAQEGMLTAPESGWLTDPERRKLEEATGKAIGISREKSCLIRKYDFYRTLTLPVKKLMISWSLRSEEGGALQPDGLIAQVKALFPDVPVRGGVTDSGRQAEPVTPLAALDGAGMYLRDLRSGDAADVPPAWKTALISLLHNRRYGDITRQILKELQPEGENRTLKAETARRLFMTDRLSVSRLEQFAACPYRHFIDYGLRPVRQETFDFESSDAGTFFHAALENYINRAGADEAWPDFTEEQVDSYMDAVCAELTEEWKDSPLDHDAVGEWTGEGYLRRVRHAAQVLTRFAANSDFRTIATEQSFGEAEGLPAVVIPLADGSQAAVRGKIDRIDTWKNGEGVWLRIVDNKSREKKPDPAKAETGEQLQLMIYLKAASEYIPEARLAGAMFFPVTDREVETAMDDPARIEADRLSTVRMKGLVTAEEDVLRAMDRDISPYSVDKVFNKDGSVSKSASWAMEEKRLRDVMNAAVDKAGELCGRMRGGEIEAAPRKDKLGMVCRYCDYHAVCRAGADQALERDEGTEWKDIAEKHVARK